MAEAGRSEVVGDDDSRGDKRIVNEVRDHYNNLKQTNLSERSQSRIYFLRNFNNWTKSMIINDVVKRIQGKRGYDTKIRALDLGCGKGGDLLKWKSVRINYLLGVDLAPESIADCQERYAQHTQRGNYQRHQGNDIFDADFFDADCTHTDIKEKFMAMSKGKGRDSLFEFDITSSQFVVHYSFGDMDSARTMLRNACQHLRPGGYFIGTIPNAYELIRRLRESDSMEFGNDVYRVKFHLKDKENIPLFGAKYNFNLDGVVDDCPEFVVYFPLLQKMLEELGMEHIGHWSFAEFFEMKEKEDRYHSLMKKIKSLQTYPVEAGQCELPEEQFDHAKAFYENLQRSGRPSKLGTLSKDEWEATSIYMVFMFQKKHK